MSDDRPGDRYFLSYSRADQDFALRLANDLRANGISVWVDQLDIRPSEHWDRAIEQAVRDCCGLLVLLSPRSAASDNVADEISFAIDHRKSVLPVMIERCRLPLRIARMQVIDATGEYAQAFEQCLEAMAPEAHRSSPKLSQEALKRFDDPDAIASMKRELTGILGPIASILVDKEASRARSATELRSKLADHIADPHDRGMFAGSAPAVSSAPTTAPASSSGAPKAGPAIGKDELDRLTVLLTPFLGPLASVIARREGAHATSADDLEQRLASRIPDPRERAQFLKKLQRD